MTKFALFKYLYSSNLGDEIQSIAARRFLPQIDYYVERDDFDRVHVDHGTRLIANGWYTHTDTPWPPSRQNLNPLFIAFHITPNSYKTFSRPDVIDYLKKQEPIGCRDYVTLDFLKDKGVDAYFSGCMTLTLPSRKVEKSDEILFVDMPEKLHHIVPDELKHSQVIMGNEYTPLQLFLQRIERKFHLPVAHGLTFKAADKLLDRFAAARLVVTSRLHCALPCIAMGTPVYFILSNPLDPRFKGLIHLTNHITSEALSKNSDLINWRQPPQNPDGLAPIKENLEMVVQKFIQTGEKIKPSTL